MNSETAAGEGCQSCCGSDGNINSHVNSHPHSSNNNNTYTSSNAATTFGPSSSSEFNYHGQFEVLVAKDDFKFNAAHFVAYEGFRERLHGHNYRVSVRLTGSHQLSADGYVVDFGVVKKETRALCKELNERLIVPMNSDVIDISFLPHPSSTSSSTSSSSTSPKKRGKEIVSVEEGGEEGSINGAEHICMKCQDGAVFVVPKGDCALLPIVHSTVEELSLYIFGQLVTQLGLEYLQERNVRVVEIGVSESSQQLAVYKAQVPASPEQLHRLLSEDGLRKVGKVWGCAERESNDDV